MEQLDQLTHYRELVQQVIHLRLRDDGKVLIEYDGIEYGIAHDLIEAGIAKEDILLNMYATPRPVTEAIAA